MGIDPGDSSTMWQNMALHAALDGLKISSFIEPHLDVLCIQIQSKARVVMAMCIYVCIFNITQHNAQVIQGNYQKGQSIALNKNKRELLVHLFLH